MVTLKDFGGKWRQKGEDPNASELRQILHEKIMIRINYLLKKYAQGLHSNKVFFTYRNTKNEHVFKSSRERKQNYLKKWSKIVKFSFSESHGHGQNKATSSQADQTEHRIPDSQR